MLKCPWTDLVLEFNPLFNQRITTGVQMDARELIQPGQMKVHSPRLPSLSLNTTSPDLPAVHFIASNKKNSPECFNKRSGEDIREPAQTFHSSSLLLYRKYPVLMKTCMGALSATSNSDAESVDLYCNIPDADSFSPKPTHKPTYNECNACQVITE